MPLRKMSMARKMAVWEKMVVIKKMTKLLNKMTAKFMEMKSYKKSIWKENISLMLVNSQKLKMKKVLKTKKNRMAKKMTKKMGKFKKFLQKCKPFYKSSSLNFKVKKSKMKMETSSKLILSKCHQSNNKWSSNSCLSNKTSFRKTKKKLNKKSFNNNHQNSLKKERKQARDLKVQARKRK